jgi:hypothetical protein
MRDHLARSATALRQSSKLGLPWPSLP